MRNEYIPYPAIIQSIRNESFDTKTFKVAIEDKRLAASFGYKPGQFAQLSLLGIGEAPVSITSSPCNQGFLEFTIRAIGRLTRAIHQLKPGDRIHVRGPYGNSFPLEEVKGKNLYFIAGGIGLPPLRSVINAVFDKREAFGKIKILYGAKTPDELCFKEELKSWQGIAETEVLLTVDEPDKGWKGASPNAKKGVWGPQGNVGVVTTLWDKTDITSAGGVAYVCGPPIMIRFVVERLVRTGFEDENIYVSLERYMKCGIGKCGHCNIGAKFVCLDGPVFTYGELKNLPEKEKAMAI